MQDITNDLELNSIVFTFSFGARLSIGFFLKSRSGARDLYQLDYLAFA
jgi:hypothetical protein